jgi:hypothetical protein
MEDGGKARQVFHKGGRLARQGSNSGTPAFSAVVT